jgi:hypothetical protein
MGQGDPLGNSFANGDAVSFKEKSNYGHSDGEEHRADCESTSLANTSDGMTEQSRPRTSIADWAMSPLVQEKAPENLQDSNSASSVISTEEERHVAAEIVPKLVLQ